MIVDKEPELFDIVTKIEKSGYGNTYVSFEPSRKFYARNIVQGYPAILFGMAFKALWRSIKGVVSGR